LNNGAKLQDLSQNQANARSVPAWRILVLPQQ
jgi:hypothetical protein